MPLTASETLDNPRDAILAQARAAFVEKGFDGASMQDLARAAGMSAGNFYRYFPSKAAIVEAFVARELTLIDTQFAAIERAADPLSAIFTTIRGRLAPQCLMDQSLWAEIVAAAHRRPEIAAALVRLEDTVLGHILRLIALLKRIPEATARERYSTHARFMLLLVRGVEMECTLHQVPPADLVDMVAAETERLMTHILADGTPR